MVKALESMGIVPLQFRLDGRRPDLTKLDSLLGLLASESSMFAKQSVDFSARLKGLTASLAAASLSDVQSSSTTTTSSSKDEVDAEVAEPVVEQPVAVAQKPVAEKPKKKSEDDRCCVICEERPMEVALLECGHASFCQQCAVPLKECPICRQSVVRFIRIYSN